MKYLKPFFLSFIVLLTATVARAESSYDIKELYAVSKPASGTIAIGRFNKTENVEYILTPTRVDKGKYIVEVKKIEDNLYQIKGSDLCVETRHCHEWASFSKEVVLIIDSNFGYTKGKIIFD